MPRILVVDDDQQLRHNLSELFTEEGSGTNLWP